MVKDKIAQIDKLGTLQTMITLAIRIDNRLYKRSLERKGYYTQGERHKKEKQRQR
jgi:hypothetical protein